MTEDERIRRLERWLSELYRDAEREMRGKWDEYMSRQEKRAETLLSRVREAKTDEERKAAEAKYQAFLRSKTFGEKYYRDMVEELARQYANANAQAVKIVNGERIGAFADGYNYGAQKINSAAISRDIGIRFDMMDKDAIEWLAERAVDAPDTVLLPPPKKLNIPEDERWNAKNINAQVSQGIVQGESIDKIAARLQNVTDMNEVSAMRNARTMVIGARNAGHVQSMKNAEKWKINLLKTWRCRHDSKTRDTHLELDGESVETDKAFWNGCRWPGDYLGPPEEVYNCRCRLVTDIKGFSSNLPKGKENAVRIWVDGERVK